MSLQRFLKNAALFQGLTARHLASILRFSTAQSANEHDYIFREGEPATALFIVGAGQVALEMQLSRPDGSATPPTTVASVEPGEALAWSAIVEPHILTMSAKAMENTDLVRIDAAALRRFLSRNRRAGYVVMVNLAKVLADRLHDTREIFVYERSALWNKSR